MLSFKESIKELATQIGFDLVGIATASVPSEAANFQNWLDAGFAADMKYLARRKEERFHPDMLLPNARSVIACAVLYNRRRERSIDLRGLNKIWISRYAWGADYHFVVGKMLDELAEQIQTKLAPDFQFKCYVDTGPVLERVFAYRAGLGWFGKNSCLIHPRLGSYFFLGVLLTDLELPPDQPQPERCGTCTRCLDVCPTRAIVVPRVVDSRSCISYQTIENRGEIPDELRHRLGACVFGCDICQEVCPWNRKAPLTRRMDFEPDAIFFQPKIAELVQLVVEDYPKSFRRSPLKRIKQLGLLRNLLVVIGNSGQKELLPILQTIESLREEKLAASCDWARQQLLHSF